MPDEFELIEGREVPAAEILQVLSDGYGRPFGPVWYQWKHVDGPWGPSRSVLARDGEAFLGVVFGLPWRYHVDGAIVDGIRLVDGATRPGTVRRGVFRRIVRELIDPTDGSLRPPIVIATATPAAQGAHVKNGAVALEPIDSWYRPTWYSVAALDTGALSPDEPLGAPPAGTVATAWDAASLQWRTNPASGTTYSMARLAQSDGGNGIVYRAGPRRSLIVTACWGPERERRTLVRAVAWRQRAVAVLAPSGPGTFERAPRVGVRGGRSLVCVWDRTDAQALDLGDRAAWSLRGLDLEGIV